MVRDARAMAEIVLVILAVGDVARAAGF